MVKDIDNKRKWFIVETIPQNTQFMMSINLQFMVQEYPRVGLGDKVKQYFTWFEKDLSKMCYVREEFDGQSEYLAQKMLTDPQWALTVIKDIEYYTKNLFVECKKLYKKKFQSMTNYQLANAFRAPLHWHRIAQGYGTSVSFYADAHKERVTKGIYDVIAHRIKFQNLNLIPSVVFSDLSTPPPSKKSILKKEEIGLLNIIINKGTYKQLVNHAKKYEWINYQYKGPAFSLDYFLDRAKALRNGKKSANTLLKEFKQNDYDLVKRQKQLFHNLNFTKQEKLLIKMAQELVYIKDYRKEGVYYAMYCYEPLFKEIGRRYSMSLDQVRAMNWWEIFDLLENHNRVNIEHLNGRLKQSIGYVTKTRYIYYVGERVKRFLDKIQFESKKKTAAREFMGTCAFPGQVRGVVKIVNIPEDMEKMKKGDILVSHNTNPNLVPAMKMSAAMISAAGGLTCHTAIVARELRIPTIVGVEKIDEILKDGDVIEVDAAEGIIKKLTK